MKVAKASPAFWQASMTISSQPALATPESLTISVFLAPNRKQASPACSIEPFPKITSGITNLVIDIFAPSSLIKVIFSLYYFPEERRKSCLNRRNFYIM
nr:hypothetical protein [Peribacillus sp. TH16]